MYSSDDDWIREGGHFGWELPAPAKGLWRLWGVRHVRSAFRIWVAYNAFTHGQWRALWREEWLAYAIRRGMI